MHSQAEPGNELTNIYSCYLCYSWSEKLAPALPQWPPGEPGGFLYDWFSFVLPFFLNLGCTDCLRFYAFPTRDHFLMIFCPQYLPTFVRQPILLQSALWFVGNGHFHNPMV